MNLLKTLFTYPTSCSHETLVTRNLFQFVCNFQFYLIFYLQFTSYFIVSPYILENAQLKHSLKIPFFFGPLNRLEGKHLPLPPAMNGTQWGQATMARNLERNCPSNKPCANVICPDPFECVDLWNEYECT